jgi:2-polyprenyl-3-methyl-5-hydroxy-6-metoxy-1,4-benzoquinol methylase
MAIDPDKVKKFWENRAERLGKIPLESLTNLEENPELLKIKVEKEQAKVGRYLSLNSSLSVLDLGAGVGSWSAFLAPHVRKVCAVEFASSLAELGQKTLAEKGLTNVEFVNSPAQQFTSSEKFDLVFISGLLIYLNDAECQQMVQNAATYTRPGSQLFLRDGTGLQTRYEINNQYSENLKTLYSAVYRTRDEYIALFESAGFRLVKDENMFDESVALNKFSQTRLRIYLFEKRD